MTSCNESVRDALIEQIEAHDIISFDIFDTLIMRKVYYNKDVFLLMAQSLDPKLGSVFFDVRTNAQAMLTLDGYPYIEDIYDEASCHCHEMKGRETDLITQEIALERKLIVPRYDVVDVFNLAKQMGKMVNIVSDMYFHQETIRLMLDDAGISGYQKMMISSEYHTGKPQHLFEVYLNEVPKGRCLHIGDSWNCDIYPARKLGIDTFQLKMSTEIYEQAEKASAPSDLCQRTQIAQYVAEKYNSPF